MSKTDSIVREFDPGRVKPFEQQPRKRFRGIAELARSMKSVGQIIPGKVVLLKDAGGKKGVGGGGFEAQLIDGERRLRACMEAGIQFRAEVQAHAGTVENQFELSLAANFGKQDHDCIEIAESLGRLQTQGRTLKQMADICGGKSTTWVAQHLSLLKLHLDVQAMLLPAESEDGGGQSGETTLAFTSALMLANHPHELQRKFARQILKRGMSHVEARRMILRESQKLGIQAGKNTRSPVDHFLSLQGCIRHITHRLGVFVDMPGKDLTVAIAAGNIRSRDQMVDAINELNDNLSAIADAIEASLKTKAGVK